MREKNRELRAQLKDLRANLEAHSSKISTLIRELTIAKEREQDSALRANKLEQRAQRLVEHEGSCVERMRAAEHKAKCMIQKFISTLDAVSVFQSEFSSCKGTFRPVDWFNERALYRNEAGAATYFTGEVWKLSSHSQLSIGECNGVYWAPESASTRVSPPTCEWASLDGSSRCVVTKGSALPPWILSRQVRRC